MNKKIRGFEKISYSMWEKAVSEENINVQEAYDNIVMPARKTYKSAGYDICSAIDFTLNPGESKKVPTGCKVYMQSDEFFAVYIRSSLGIKKDIMLKNQVGIIDADFYNNPDNEGHFVVAIINNGKEPFVCKKGEAIAQGIFQKYFTIDNEDVSKMEMRVGGIGSTSEKILQKVLIEDAEKMLEIQKASFEKYAETPKGFLCVEMSAGQMVEDVRLAVEGKAPVYHYGRMGGMLFNPEDVLEDIKRKFEVEKL